MMLEEELPSTGRRVSRRLIPVLIQMKALQTIQGHHLETWANAAHARAAHLSLKNGSYFVVLYVLHTPEGDGWKAAIRKGTIVIRREDLVQFLGPFGMTPILHMLDTQAPRRAEAAMDEKEK